MNTSCYQWIIYVDQMGQLFATFASGNGDDIMVSFDLIAKLNYTSKDTQRMYYYLKLSPK